MNDYRSEYADEENSQRKEKRRKFQRNHASGCLRDSDKAQCHCQAAGIYQQQVVYHIVEAFSKVRKELVPPVHDVFVSSM